VQDPLGHIHETPQGIIQTFARYFNVKYAPIGVDASAIVEMAKTIRKISPNTYAELAEQPITPEEIHAALQKGRRNKAPGSDGIGLEVYTTNWKIIKEEIAEILNQMYLQRSITQLQKEGIIICLPKSNAIQTPEGYRPIALLISDYELLARILANRLRPVLEDYLRSSQFCSVPGNSIIEVVSIIRVREAVAHAEITDTPLCVLTLDFREAFYRIARDYLFTILKIYGICPWFIDRIKDLYENATASIQINGKLAEPIPIKCAIRQGCPLRMLLYALCLHPLLHMLENKLPDIQMGHRARRTAVVAYADDLMIFVTSPTDFKKINEAIHIY
jgi:hypothetical protein